MGKRALYRFGGSSLKLKECPGRTALSRNGTFHARRKPLALWTYFYICLELLYAPLSHSHLCLRSNLAVSFLFKGF